MSLTRRMLLVRLGQAALAIGAAAVLPPTTVRTVSSAPGGLLPYPDRENALPGVAWRDVYETRSRTPSLWPFYKTIDRVHILGGDVEIDSFMLAPAGRLLTPGDRERLNRFRPVRLARLRGRA